ncbi:variable large family protein (plasmid) [Borrelia turicatae]|nr:variable large family protein [Borrelia turicatae]UPA15630.1 variable large family protein [Borrelia turicatae]
MTLFLLLSCGSGSAKAEDPQSRFLKSVISLSNDFLNVFTSLSDMVGGVLGFDTNTKKSDVGAYFKKVHDTVSSTKTTLEKIVEDMKNAGNPNAATAEIAVNKLVSETLDKIIEGAKTASDAIGDAGESITNVAVQNGGAAGEVDKLVDGIKGIVELVLKEGKYDAGTDKKAEDGNTQRGANAGEAGKLFDSNANAGDGKKVSTDAAKAVGAVTGADILKAMVKNTDSIKLAKNAGAIAAVGVAANAKDGTIAGGIALRAMAKGGKFANISDAESKKSVEDVAISAVTKALHTLTIAIRNTIDVGLKSVKEAMKINSTDTSVTTDNTTSETKKN